MQERPAGLLDVGCVCFQGVFGDQLVVLRIFSKAPRANEQLRCEKGNVPKSVCRQSAAFLLMGTCWLIEDILKLQNDSELRSHTM